MATTDPDRPPLTEENLDRIRARMLVLANLGVDPTSPGFLDAIEGSIFGDLEGPTAIELDEGYDFANIVVAQTIPSTASGEHLDDWAESFGLERRDQASASGVVTFSGTPGFDVPTGTQVTTTPVSDDDPIAFSVNAGATIGGGGTVDRDVTAVLAGSAGNLPANAVNQLAVELDGVAGVTNAAPMTGGADVESDELLSARLQDALSGDVGSGTQADYRRWLLALPGVGFVTVRPIARGPGTVDAYITDLNNDPMSPTAVASAQAYLDPVSGQGLGVAPIGHDALVLTPASTGVTVAATIAPEVGYSLDGAAGTRATRATIIAAVTRYIDSLDVGEDVVRNKVIAAIVDVQGVADVTAGTLTLNGAGAGDLAIAGDHVAFTSAVNLT